MQTDMELEEEQAHLLELQAAVQSRLQSVNERIRNRHAMR